MGRMKELFIEQQNEMEADNTFYKGVHDSMIHGLARKAIEEYIEERENNPEYPVRSYRILRGIGSFP